MWSIDHAYRASGDESQLTQALARLGQLGGQRDFVQRQLDLLDAPNSYGKAITDASEAATPAAVVAGWRKALVKAARWFESDPGFMGLKAARDKVAAIEAKLAASDPDSQLAATLIADLDTAKAAAKTLQASLDQKREEAAAATLEKAKGGDLAAGAELEQVVQSDPKSFPSGFSTALAAARGTEAQLRGTLGAILIRGGI